MALSVDAQDRLWAVWTQRGVLHAARSRSHGMDFGATVSVPLPAAAYQVSALGLAGGPGTVDVVVNTGTSLVEQAVRPGLSVRVFKKTKKVGKKTVVTWSAQALDDGVGVAGARFSAPGHHATGNSSGTAQLTSAGFRRGSAKAAALGYVSASFRVG